MRRLGILLLLAGAAAAAQAIEVSAPRSGATLHGGSYAILSWSAEKVPAHAEEWEAFLSIDGGKHYAFRVTPHLDLALRRVTWLVPNVDASEARILIRTGDEKDEREFVLPMAFVILRDSRQSLTPPRIAATEEGERGVIQWAEGDRAGTRVTQVVIVIPPGRMTSLRAVDVSEAAPADAPKRSQTRAHTPIISNRTEATEQLSNLSHPVAFNILLKTHRQNI